MQNFQDVQLAARTISSRLPRNLLDSLKGGCGIVLGTGLSEIGQCILPDAHAIPFSQIPFLPDSSVASHKGTFLIGQANNKGIVIQCGRLHLYEGHSPAIICAGIRIMKELGLETVILTNSAGALNPLFNAGSLMVIADIINHTGISPLQGPNYSSWGERFPDMSAPLSPKLMAVARQCALENGISLEKGVYIGVHGPEMETPAETRMYRQWGADAVGMSTVLEIIAARHAGLNCLGIACLTNKNLPDCMLPAPLEAVLEAANKMKPQIMLLLQSVLAKILV